MDAAEIEYTAAAYGTPNSKGVVKNTTTVGNLRFLYGFYLFNDLGRVWVTGEDSKKWHDGFGIGLWLTPFNFTALNVAYAHSVEEDMITFSFRFLF